MSNHLEATAIAHPNIAFVKYWGNADPVLRLPATPSLSMNLGGLTTTTTVAFQDGLEADGVIINGEPASSQASQRVTEHLDRLRALAGTGLRAQVLSCNSFPTGAGLASSASAFAALTLAGAAALQLALTEQALSALARLGSGSACRSIPSGFVEWLPGKDHETSIAHSIAGPDHWALRDCIATLSTAHKTVGSAEGHDRAPSSPLYGAWVEGAAARFAVCKAAILERDLAALGEVMESDTMLMHAVTMTSRPPVYYWSPETLHLMHTITTWRAEGLAVYWTIDAGPNVHCICEEAQVAEVVRRLEALPYVQQVLVARPGGGARLISERLPQ